MSLVNLAHVCSHLQNASKARLGLTSIPLTNLHLRLCLGMQKQGFFSSVQIAGMAPPIDKVPSPKSRSELTEALAKEPWLVYNSSDIESDSKSPLPSEYQFTVSPNLPRSPGKRRIWLGLKYFENYPVLSEMSLVSKPTRRISMSSSDLGQIVRGRKAGYINGLTRPGECLFVSTDRGILEARECVEKKMGGLLLCRVI